jgi:hypothetical protein
MSKRIRTSAVKVAMQFPCIATRLRSINVVATRLRSIKVLATRLRSIMVVVDAGIELDVVCGIHHWLFVLLFVAYELCVRIASGMLLGS